MIECPPTIFIMFQLLSLRIIIELDSSAAEQPSSSNTPRMPHNPACPSNSRLFKLERETGKLIGEWVYQLADPQSFGFDPSLKQNEPRISEIAALGPDRLLVLERTDKTTKLFEITLAGATNILGTSWDDVATSPSLEQLRDAPSVSPVTKVLRFDTFRDLKDAPEKIEGIAFLQDGSLVLINDNDFGIRGDATKVVIVNGAVSADPEVWKK
jgi:hypothetical protein